MYGIVWVWKLIAAHPKPNCRWLIMQCFPSIALNSFISLWGPRYHPLTSITMAEQIFYDILVGGTVPVCIQYIKVYYIYTIMYTSYIHIYIYIYTLYIYNFVYIYIYIIYLQLCVYINIYIYLENQNPKNSSGQRKNLKYFGKNKKTRFSIEDLGYWFWTRTWPVPNPYLTRT